MGGINFGRLLVFLLIAILGQRAISYLCYTFLPFSPLAILIVTDILIGFFMTVLYYPMEGRRGILKNPYFYRDAIIFSSIFLAIDFLMMVI